MALEKYSKVELRRTQGKLYYRVQIPKEIAENVIGLRNDIEGQSLRWRLDKGKLVVEKD